jgi:hypothetical protein
MRWKIPCGAYTRTTGNPCLAKALANGRCRMHGGLSTGPRSEAGRKRIGEAARSRLAAGDQAKLQAGFREWLDRRRATFKGIA